MSATRLILLTTLAATMTATARADDGMGARANAGRPMRIAESNDSATDKPSILPRRRDSDPVDQWTALATRVSAISDVSGTQGAPPSVNAAIASETGEGRTLPRTLARRDTGAIEAAASPLEALRSAPTRSLLPLGITLGAIVVLALAVRKWSPSKSRVGGGRVIQVLSRHALSNKHSLCLVRVGQGLVLLGVTPERIATLIEITDAEEVSRILGTARSSLGESFSTTLRGLARRPAAADEDSFEPERALPVARLSSAGETVRDLVSRVRQFSGASGVAKPI